MTEQILIVGRGARKHALAKRLRDESADASIWCHPGNACIDSCIAQSTPAAADTPDALAAWAAHQRIDLAIVIDERAMFAAVTDRLRENGIPTSGASRAAAAAERSRADSKALFARLGLATPPALVADGPDVALDLLRRLPERVVVKAAAATGSKHVDVCSSHADARRAIERYSAADGIVIEPFVEGVEHTITLLTDGRNFVLLPPVTEDQFAHGPSAGPLTGGMGAFSHASVAEEWAALAERFGRPILEEFAARGHKIVGQVALDLLTTYAGDVYLLEANVHLGDPQLQTALPLVDGRLTDVFTDLANGRLEAGIEWRTGRAAVACTIAAAGYGTGATVSPEMVVPPSVAGVEVYAYDSVPGPDGTVAAGGRVWSVCADGDSLATARRRCGWAARALSFTTLGTSYREDLLRAPGGATAELVR